jgi:hypothetical protein
VPHNNQMQRTVETRHVRAASAPFHYAPAARWTRGRAAADLGRHTVRMAYRSGESMSASTQSGICAERG